MNLGCTRNETCVLWLHFDDVFRLYRNIAFCGCDRLRENVSRNDFEEKIIFKIPQATADPHITAPYRPRYSLDQRAAGQYLGGLGTASLMWADVG